MAEQDNSQKTEEPTQRRLDKAFEEGSVPKSPEVTSWCLLAAGTLIIAMVSGPLLVDMRGELLQFLERPDKIDLSGHNSEGLVSSIGLMLLKTLALPFGIMCMAALGGHLLQHRPTWSMSPLEFNLEKLSPLKGFGRIFGMQGIVNFVKSIFKLAIVGTAASLVLWPQRDLLLGFVGLRPQAILPSAQILSLKVLGAILVSLAVVALADLFFQRMQHRNKLRMTKQEVKEEHKDTEGDPKIKAKIRQIRMERSRRRMMQAVPKATVVIANPTHFAVALRYVDKEMKAPVCVAKGVDELALRIRFAAKEHNVTIVENPPLARALYATVEVDEVIPQEHYKAVAEVIGYVLRLKNRGRPAIRRPRQTPVAPRIN